MRLLLRYWGSPHPSSERASDNRAPKTALTIPSRPVRIIGPTPTVDRRKRSADPFIQISRCSASSAVVDNRPGEPARSAASRGEGRTRRVYPAARSPHTINVHVLRHAPTIRSGFKPISLTPPRRRCSRAPGCAGEDAQEFIALARHNPAETEYGSAAAPVTHLTETVQAATRSISCSALQRIQTR